MVSVRGLWLACEGLPSYNSLIDLRREQRWQMQDSDRSRVGGRPFKPRLLLFILVPLLGYGIYLGAAVYERTRPMPGQVPGTSALSYEEVALDSCDDTVLTGWYGAGNNGAGIILLHDEGETRTEVVEEATVLAEAGYSVLLFDRRGHGESSRVLRAGGWDDLGDVYNAWDWLAARPEVEEERIGVYGSGVGGQIALRAAAFSRRIYAVAARDPAVAASGDRPEKWSERLIFRGMAWRTGIPEPFAVVDVIQDIAPRPVLLLVPEEGESTVAERFYARAREPKGLQTGGEASTLVPFFDKALLGDGVAQQ